MNCEKLLTQRREEAVNAGAPPVPDKRPRLSLHPDWQLRETGRGAAGGKRSAENPGAAGWDGKSFDRIGRDEFTALLGGKGMIKYETL